MKYFLKLLLITLPIINGSLSTADDIDIYLPDTHKQTTLHILLAVHQTDQETIKRIVDSFYQSRRPALIGLIQASENSLAHPFIDISKDNNLESLTRAINQITATQTKPPVDKLLRQAAGLFPDKKTACAEKHILLFTGQATKASEKLPDDIQVHRIEANQTNDKQTVTRILNGSINHTIEAKGNFTAPAIAVNAYNSLQHRNDMYFALFKPSLSARWAGNIKKYRLFDNKIIDANGEDAIQQDKHNAGYFKQTALSFWTELTDWNPSDDNNTATVDGSVIPYGGYAYRLNSPATRKLYTYLDDFTPNNELLAAEPLIVENANITASLLGLKPSEDDKRKALLKWTQGYEIEGYEVEGYEIELGEHLPNYFVADVIHNQPAVVTYRTINPATEDFDDTLFAGSNRGFLHAIDANTGDPIFSFIPRQLLTNLTSYYQNKPPLADKPYGFDAPMTVWRQDSNGNGSVVTSYGHTDKPETGDHVYIYQAMRRGGNSLFAFDVSVRNNPKLMWQINGDKDLDGDGSSDATPGFSQLGETWSRPQLATIQWNCTRGDTSGCQNKKVIFFAGGYDNQHDNASHRKSGHGNAIYMVDAVSGELLWSAGRRSHDLNLSNMNYSIPANVTPVDIDGDGYIDALFAIDIIGQLWRFDFNHKARSQSDFAKTSSGGMIADLSGAGRRFYNAPDVAYIARRGQPPLLSIAVGSGYRAQPENTSINDRFFVVFDYYPLTAPPNYRYADNAVITTSDMSPVTQTQRLNDSEEKYKYGWYLNMDNGKGEKILSSSITFNHQLLLTSYTPGKKTTVCSKQEIDIGTGKYYLLDLFKGNSVLTVSDSSKPYGELQRQGIPPEPTIIFTSNSSCSSNCNVQHSTADQENNVLVCIGTECSSQTIDLSLHKTYWREL